VTAIKYLHRVEGWLCNYATSWMFFNGQGEWLRIKCANFVPNMWSLQIDEWIEIQFAYDILLVNVYVYENYFLHKVCNFIEASLNWSNHDQHQSWCCCPRLFFLEPTSFLWGEGTFFRIKIISQRKIIKERKKIELSLRMESGLSNGGFSSNGGPTVLVSWWSGGINEWRLPSYPYPQVTSLDCTLLQLESRVQHVGYHVPSGK